MSAQTVIQKGGPLPRFVASIDVDAICKLLETCQIGEAVTYEQITEAIGRDAQSHRHLIATALRRTQKINRAVFEAVPGVGYRRLNDSEIVQTGQSKARAIFRAAKRGMRKLACANYEALNEGEKIAHNANMTVLALASEVTSHSSTRRITQTVQQAGGVIPAAHAAIAALSISKKDQS